MLLIKNKMYYYFIKLFINIFIYLKLIKKTLIFSLLIINN